MSTFFDNLMRLPIFNGMAADQFEDFMEYLPLDFVTYEPREIIIEPGERANMVRCVISGKVLIEHEAFGGMIDIQETWPSGTILGLDRLFGMDTTYHYSCKAITRCGILQFSKQRFLDLIKTRDICMINFMNYISLRAQRTSIALSKIIGKVQLHRLESAVLLLTDSYAESVKFTLKMKDKLPLYKLSDLDKIHIQEFIDRGLLEWVKGQSISMPSRKEFLGAMESVKIKEVELS